MSVTIEGTATTNVSTAVGDTIDSASHTVTADTTLLLLFTGVGYEDSDVTTVEDWTTTTEPFVYIGRTNPPVNGDAKHEVWGIVNPTAKTNTITVTFATSGDNHCRWACLVNCGGTETASVAAATNILEQVDNGSAGTTTVFASAGTAGNGLAVTGSVRGDNATATINASFTELIDSDTGGNDTGFTDASFYFAYLLNGAPAAPTITWSQSRVNAGIYLEIVARRAVYINDAPTLDAGAVKQPYPGVNDWNDTSIAIQDPPDITGLTPPLYVIVQTEDGATASRRIAVGEITSVSTDDDIDATETNWVVAGSGFGDD